VVAAVFLVIAAATAPLRAQDANAPCPTCIWLALPPDRVPALPGSLNGLRILLATPVANAGHVAGSVELVRARGGTPGVLVELSAATDGDMDRLAFETKTALTALRGSQPGVPLTFTAPLEIRDALTDRGMKAYVDFIAEDRGVLTRALDATQHAPGQHALWRLPDDPAAARDILVDLAKAASWLPASLVPVAAPEVRCGDRSAATFTDPSSLATIAVFDRCDSPADLQAVPPAEGNEQLALSTGGLLVRIPAAGGQFADDVRVVGARQLTVEEIIARHQAWTARQRAEVATLISTGSMTLTFEAPGFGAPVAITSDVVIYKDAERTEIEQRDIRVNGISFGGGSVPRLPIIEPERVASPPLSITLTDVYRYKAEGNAAIDGTRCHVVSFEPVDQDAALFRGRAWIAADTFAMVRVAAVQTGLRGPITSAEQIDTFESGTGRWLLERSDVRQMYEGAGHRTPIHRVMTIARHVVNPPDFTERRAAAYASAPVMLRDTPQGYRYLRLPSPDGRPAGEPVAEPTLAPAAERVRTLAAGVIIDPNITRPLPFAGLSYADFDLFGTGTQFTAFFGGTYGQLALSVPSLGGSRWQLAARASGIASSYNDRAFTEGREIFAENIRQRPAHASVAVLRPVSGTTSVRFGYDLDYTNFGEADVTDPAFVVPADQLAHSARAAIETQKSGWHLSGWWTGSVRSGWRAWGFAPGAERGSSQSGEYDPAHRDYQRYGATAARPLVISTRLVARIEAAWMDGRSLDRFSRYAFGTFDNRLRGYPSALIRYDRGGALRFVTAWAAGRVLRVDGFVDTAYVHDPGFGDGLRRYSGVGAALETPGPFGMLLAAEWGYGFQGVTSDGSRGTQVVRVTGYKIF
jgi:hypothetical protein